MKTFFTIIALCGAMGAFAQIEKGRSFISGNAGFTKNNYKDSDFRTSNVTANLGYGYLIGNKLAVGLELDGGADMSGNTATASHNKSISIAPFVRRYFLIAEKLYFNLDGQLSYGWAKHWQTPINQPMPPSNTSNRYGVAISPGLTFFAAKKVAINANLGSISYSTTKDQKGTGSAQTAFSTNLGLRYFSFGASIYF